MGGSAAAEGRCADSRDTDHRIDRFRPPARARECDACRMRPPFSKALRACGSRRCHRALSPQSHLACQLLHVFFAITSRPPRAATVAYAVQPGPTRRLPCIAVVQAADFGSHHDAAGRLDGAFRRRILAEREVRLAARPKADADTNWQVPPLLRVEAHHDTCVGTARLVGTTLGPAIPAAGQWLNHPTKGIPRTADGRADLAAPAPLSLDGHPDLSGIVLGSRDAFSASSPRI